MNSVYYENDFGNKTSLKEFKIYLDIEIFAEEYKTGTNIYNIVWGNTGKLENELKI